MPNIRLDDDGWTPLHWYAWQGNLETAKYLIEYEMCDINAKSAAGFTPLHKAAEANRVEIIKLLLDSGADINALDMFGDSALAIAERYGALDAVELLMYRSIT
jgi:ankyrin repeat protein